MRGIALQGVPPEFTAQQAETPEKLCKLNDVIMELVKQGWDLTPAKRIGPWAYETPQHGSPFVAEYRRACGATRRLTLQWPPQPRLCIHAHTRHPAWVANPATFSGADVVSAFTALEFSLRDVRREGDADGPVVAFYEELT